MGGEGLKGLAPYWPALNRSLETNRALALENQQREMTLGRERGTASDLSKWAGGYDPQTDIYWNTGRPGYGDSNPIGSDPMAQLAARVDPKGALSTIMTRMTAPPSNYQVTGPDGKTRTGMYTPKQIMDLQAQGFQVNEVEKSKPIDPNQAPSLFTVPGSDNREHTSIWRPGMTNPQPFGGPGKFVNLPQSDIGKLQFDMQNFMGGGSSLGTGSGAPNVGVPPKASPSTQSGLSFVSDAAKPPTLGAPYDPASERDPVRRPWLTPPTAAGQIPSMADIVRNKMTEMATPQSELARQKAAAEATVKPFGYDKEQTDKRAKLEQAYNSAMQGFDDTTGVIDTLTDPTNTEGLGDITGFGGTWLGKQFTLPGSVPKWLPLLNTKKGLPASTMEAKAAQLEAKSFLQGLAGLKAASPTGATGLGSTTETEGNRVIQAQAALDRAQTEEDYVIALKEYKAAIAKAKENVRRAYEAEVGIGPKNGWSIELVH